MKDTGEGAAALKFVFTPSPAIDTTPNIWYEHANTRGMYFHLKIYDILNLDTDYKLKEIEKRQTIFLFLSYK